MNNENPEVVETIEPSEQDLADIHQLFATPDGGPDAEAPSYHSILEVWREVLRPAAEEGKKKVTPQWAGRMVTTYPEVTFAETEYLRDSYFSKLEVVLMVVTDAIESDPECVNVIDAEEDVERNSTHYKFILIEWQKELLRWEMAWTCTDEHAAAELGALGEVHKTLFGSPQQTGLSAFLDNIKFEYTETDQAEQAAALDEIRGEHE